MGYNFDTGKCDEVCSNCTYTNCVEHPCYKSCGEHKLKTDVRCKVCGQLFDQEVYGQTICSEECQAIWDEQHDKKISALTWIKHRGYRNKTEFIEDWGKETWEAIQ